ncbi:MAG: helix-turn-helix transcriptional regulator [Lachnospiraceae bacterium]|nr:helix-turn-helix transcriptional regulator [Lachnospiraceae bacterium]
MRQATLAAKIGVSRALITMYIKGKANPRKDKLDKMSEVLKVQTAWLQGYDVSMTAPEGAEDIKEQIRIMFDALSPEEQTELLEALLNRRSAAYPEALSAM